jgi:Ca-activated chloride channel family protein
VKRGLIATCVSLVPFISLPLFGLVIWNLSAPAVAQSFVPDDVKHDTPGRAIEQGQSVHIDVDLALVNVTVTDPRDRLVTGLLPENFRVFENNVEQEIQYFSYEDVPISIGVIFDLSGSMGNKVDKSKEAALQFLKTANPQDEFFLVGFSDHAELMSTFANSVEDLQSRIVSASAKGSTALLDAIYLGLSEMRTARNAKRALLIISDGGDNHSDPLESRSGTPEELNGPSLLTEVTELTGGRAFDVENLNQLPGIAAKIGAELRNQYILGYRPSNKSHDARWRKIKIKLHTPKGLPPLSIYAKTGYYARASSIP